MNESAQQSTVLNEWVAAIVYYYIATERFLASAMAPRGEFYLIIGSGMLEFCPARPNAIKNLPVTVCFGKRSLIPRS